ncbi:MAG TPA: MFS transporter [Terriglobales bacterium]|nr:MFS transporter [Terriglobales bacterium]
MERTVIAKLTARLIPFLFLLYIVAYLDRINVGFAALQMKEQLGFNDAVYGLGAGMFFAGYFCFQVPSNLILQKVGARRWIAALMIAWGVISSCMVFVSGAKSFYALRFLLGLAEAGFFPGVILYLKTWFPAAARARTVARFMTAAPLSGVVGGPISGALLSMQHTAGLAGWQWLFLMEGAPAVVLGLVVSYYLTDLPADAVWLSSEQRLWLSDVMNRERDNAAPSSEERTFSAFTDVRIWVLCLVYFGLNTCSYGISLWLPTLIHSRSGVNNLVIGLLSSIPYIAAAIIMVGVGLHSDKTGERRWHVAVSAFAGSAALLATSGSVSIVLTVLTMSLAVAGVFSMMGPFWAMPTSFLSGAGAAAGIALINSIGNLGGFFGPYALGWVRNATGTFRGGLLVLGASLAVSGALALAIRSGRKQAPE